MKLPQISLREMFLLVALICMGCAWWVHERVLIAERSERQQWQWRAESLKDWLHYNKSTSVSWFGNGMKITDPAGAGYNFTRPND